MACIRHRVTRRRGLCVISDRHPGIIAAMNDVDSGWTPPDAYHRFCIHHVASNLNTHVKNVEVKKQFIATSFQRKKQKASKVLRRIRHMSEVAFEYINDMEIEKWSLAFDRGLLCYHDHGKGLQWHHERC